MEALKLEEDRRLVTIPGCIPDDLHPVLEAAP